MAKDEPPNLNSPPGIPASQQPPSRTSTAPLSTTLQTNPQSPTPLQAPQSAAFVYYSCAAVAVAAPIIVLLPPRKLDLYTFGLGLAWCASAGVVLETRTGHGLLWHVGRALPSQANAERRAAEAADAADAARLREVRAEAARRGGAVAAEAEPGLVERVREQEAARKQRGIVKKLWMGREGDDWIEKRAREEREALEDGRGYGGLIADYFKEAFGLRGDDDGGEDDEKVRERLRTRNEGRKKE